MELSACCAAEQWARGGLRKAANIPTARTDATKLAGGSAPPKITLLRS